MKRRTFLGATLALGAQGMWASNWKSVPLAQPSAADSQAAAFDENLVLILSDLHTNPGKYQEEKLRVMVAEILKLNPLPRYVVALGDLAYLEGKPEEYARLREVIAPIEKSGMKLTLAMGNHDRRAAFAAAFPAHAATTKVPGRNVNVVETNRATIVVLDSLQELPVGEIVPGAIDDAQREWLRSFLAGCKKPVFVSSHHPINETKLETLLMDSPTCCGYIHGHSHVWRPGWVHRNYSDRDMVRTLCVPSTGHWGDIGYVTLRLEADHATAELHQTEFFFPQPAAKGEQKPMEWQFIEEEHRGLKCSFAYRKK